ncbi:MAG: protein kinase [Hyphomicrobiaceae bacterium]|nr:MAG: protein kinase [Hyphomicrobiaceae bacterium]
MQPKPASNNLLALPDGTELVGDFRIKRVLGAGGFGITYLAEEVALARLVTIKEYFPADFAARNGAVDASPRSQECSVDYKWGLDRFIEEAQTLARFVHPNIVRVYRYFRANNTGYMVLHFEEGGSFKSWLKGLKRAPRQAELDAIIAPLLDALDVVHKGNFLHRDIAPDNIIIRKDSSPVLIDFGSARGEIASHSKTVSALVKPGYSPYEQYATNSRQQGPWTDIYALGATLYHALAGKRPPDSPSRMVNDEYVPAREVALSAYRSTFLAAIDKALRLEVTERPQSIAEWRSALLAPEPKRERARLGLPLGRKRTAEVRPEQAPANDVTQPLAPAEPKSLVPAPPDAPQPKGQLLDFIEALKKQRPPILAPRKKAAPEPKADAKPKAEAKPEPKKKAADRPAAVLSEPRDAPSTAHPGPAPKKFAPAAKNAAKPVAAARRAPPRPRRVKSWGLPSRSWRSLAFKLLVGIGIASLAVAYQEKLPHYEGRGATVVSSQSADLAQVPRLVGHKGAVTAVASGDQGRWIVSVGSDGTMRVWNAGSGALVRTIELDEGPATAFAVDDRRALTGHKAGAVVLWDLERAEKIGVFQQREAPVTAVAFTGDPNRFAAASLDGTVVLLDERAPSAPADVLEDQEAAAQLISAARASGLMVSSGQDRSVRLWRIETHSRLRTWRGQSEGITALDIAPGGRAIAGGGADGSIRLWSAYSSRLQRSLRAHEGRVAALSFAPGDRLLASAGEDGVVKLWNLRYGRTARVFRGHAGPVRAVGFTADGRRLISGGQDGIIRVWSTLPAPRD